MILVDTTPLVALCDPRDNLHRTALADLDRLARRPLVTCAAVLVEACFLLDASPQRQRLEQVVSTLGIRPFVTDDEIAVWSDVFRWLGRYAEHGPDWADATLAVISGREKKAKVWTYDREFRTFWRRLDGSRIPMAVGSSTP